MQRAKMFDFTQKSMNEILNILTVTKKEIINIKALNPDISQGLYSGQTVSINGQTYTTRTLKSWINLAEILGYRLLTPKITDDFFIELTLKKLSNITFHTNESGSEKYGTNSIFSKIDKMQEPSFLYHLNHSLKEVKLETRANILDIGINQGDEFIAIKEYAKDKFNTLKLTGIDYSKSAIESAKQKLHYKNCTFICQNVNNLNELNLGKFDLILSIGTLQTTTINTKEVVMNLIQKHLTQNGAIIFGFPNGRWIDGELVYGAKAPNYTYPEMSLVLKDIHWIKKYLQQKKFRVSVVGKEYLFLRAVKFQKV